MGICQSDALAGYRFCALSAFTSANPASAVLALDRIVHSPHHAFLDHATGLVVGLCPVDADGLLGAHARAEAENRILCRFFFPVLLQSLQVAGVELLFRGRVCLLRFSFLNSLVDGLLALLIKEHLSGAWVDSTEKS